MILSKIGEINEMAKSPTTFTAGKAAKRLMLASATVVLLTPLGGCATNLTGFEFPSFGLMSNFSNEQQADLSQPGAMNSQSLSAAGGI